MLQANIILYYNPIRNQSKTSNKSRNNLCTSAFNHSVITLHQSNCDKIDYVETSNSFQ